MEVKVFGRVQGVGFRKKVKKFALEKDLKGFVKNNLDGSVNILVSGSKTNLNEFLKWLKNVNGLSSVKKIEILNKKIMNYSSFKIIKDKSFFLDQFYSFVNLIKSFFKEYLTIPEHVVVIPDGNRRWAKLRRLSPVKGHEKSADFNNLFSLINEARGLGVKYISFWGFSTDNWKRDKEEVDKLFELLNNLTDKLRESAHENKFRFRYFGRDDRIPKNIAKNLRKLEEETKKYDNLNVQLCLDYGGRDELVRAVNKILKSKNKKIDEVGFSKFLDSSGVPDPDLIIRTSGEQRLSGFMPWQTVHSEFYFEKKNFPDFKPADLRRAVADFGRRKRRFGV